MTSTPRPPSPPAGGESTAQPSPPRGAPMQQIPPAPAPAPAPHDGDIVAESPPGAGDENLFLQDNLFDTSSLAAHGSDEDLLSDGTTGRSASPSELQAKRSRYFENQALPTERVYNVTAGLAHHSRKMAKLDRDPTIRDLPLQEIRFNEATNRMDVTTAPGQDYEEPPFYPGSQDPGVWAPQSDPALASTKILPMSSPEHINTEPLPETPVARTPANILRDTKLVFDTRQERVFRVTWEPQATPPAAPESTSSQDSGSAPERKEITEAQLGSLLPHPDAYFLPSSLEWVIVSPAERFLNGSMPVPSRLPVDHVSYETPLFVFYADVPVDLEKQASPVATGTAQAAPDAVEDGCLKKFNIFCNVKNESDSVLVSPPRAIPALLSEDLLMRLRASRTGNPPPGMTDTSQYFYGAVRLLLRMLADALAGNTRAVVVQSKMLVQRLGWDDVTREIFDELGWRLESVSADDKREALKPPRLFAADGTLIEPAWRRMGRAWLELSLWAQHCKEKMSISEPPETKPSLFPFVPVGQPGLPAIEQVLQFDARQLEHNLPAQNLNDRVQTSLAILGVNAQEADQTVKAAYEVAVKKDARLQPQMLSAIEFLYMDQRKDAFELGVLLTEERSRGMWTYDELAKSYALLGVEGTTFDTSAGVNIGFISELYEGKMKQAQSREDIREIEDLKRALQVICRSKGDPPELVRLHEAHSGMTLSQAYSRLGVPEEAQDEQLQIALTVRLADNPERQAEFRQALHTIGVARHSEALVRLAQGQESTDGDPWTAQTDPNRPAGLNNIGNTCYLNSVLQYFFSIREIRERVIEYGEKMSSWEPPKTLRRIGGRQLTAREAERSHKFIVHLAQLFQNMISFPAAAVSPERELAYLALVSAQAEEQDEVLQAKSTSSGDTDTTLVEEAAPPASQAAGPSEQPKTQSAPERRASLMQVGAQQDVSECLDNVMFQLEVALGTLNDEASSAATEGQSDGKEDTDEPSKPSREVSAAPEPTLLSALFLGETAQRLQLVAAADEAVPSNNEVKKEIFKILPVDVLEEEGRDIYDGLDGFFDEEILTTGDSGKAIRRTVNLVRPPPLLQIQLQRVQFDRVLGRAYKSQAHIQTHQTIYLDRYCDFDVDSPDEAPRLEKRKKAQALRQEAAELRLRAESLRATTSTGAGTQPIAQTLTDTADFLNFLAEQRDSAEGPMRAALASMQVDAGFPQELRAHADSLTEELKQVEERLRAIKAESSALWDNEQGLEYTLVSLFMHRGEATHGHYFLNQRKMPVADDGSDAWFKYNDSVVSAADVKDVLRDPTGANPYLVSYVRKDMQDKLQLMETPKRTF